MFLAWAAEEKECEGCDVAVSREGDNTVTQVTMRLRDLSDAGAIVQLVFIEGARDIDCAIRILPGESLPRPTRKPVDDRSV